MKKYLPLVLLVVGIAAVILIIVAVFGKKETQVDIPEEKKIVTVIPRDKRPFVSLTPTSDGHRLSLVITNILVDADSMDYEFLYTTGEGRLEGSSDTINDLEGQETIEREFLFGTESSGNYKYDEGVEEGSLSLKFRVDGKLVGKLSTKFHLQSKEPTLTSLDEKFTYELTNNPSGYFVTMETFGVLDDPPSEFVSGPYGIFTSSSKSQSGTVIIDKGTPYTLVKSSWKKLEGDSASDVGIFAGLE